MRPGEEPSPAKTSNMDRAFSRKVSSSMARRQGMKKARTTPATVAWIPDLSTASHRMMPRRA
jgi:hypothetical protein